MEIINFLPPESGNFIVRIIAWLVSISGAVWLGIVLFTLLIKVISLPLDYVSKANMRKNSLRMEEMRDDLEKLQKQYANDKELYNQKMMALYKKNGYSMWGACLPTILTLVFFIIAINGFTNYSNIQNQQYFYDMSLAFNSVVYEGFEVDGEVIKKNADGSLTFNDNLIYADDDGVIQLVNEKGENFTLNRQFVEESGVKKLVVTTDSDNSYSQYVKTYEELTDGSIKFGIVEYRPVLDKLKTSELELNGKNYTEFLADAEIKAQEKGEPIEEISVAKDFILQIQQTRSAETYRSVEAGFFWVKNVWVADNAARHPIMTNWDEFKNSYGYEDNSVNKVTSEDYSNLIKKLDKEKTEPNGYYILVVLNAASYFLMQLVNNKAQKAQMELQTVDGQGAQTQKMMTWIMPIMMAFFAFMYTAAFSIYIVLSSLISMFTTLGINAIIDKRFKKEQQANGKKNVVRGRVYTPKQEEKKEQPKKKGGLFGKKEQQPQQDFLTGKIKKK